MSQYDVQTTYLVATGVATTAATRLRGTLCSSTTTASVVHIFQNTIQVSSYTRATTVVTVTYNGHGLSTNDWVYADFITGGALDGPYQITVTNDNVYTFSTIASGTIGASVVNIYNNHVMSVNLAIAGPFDAPLPGNGIKCSGIFISVPASTTVSIYYD